MIASVRQKGRLESLGGKRRHTRRLEDDKETGWEGVVSLHLNQAGSDVGLRTR
jgi:hypothetical protein